MTEKHKAEAHATLHAYETLTPDVVLDALASVGLLGDGRLMAPHISFWIVARGINLGLNTRMYFGDEEKANSVDPILARVEHRVRVRTLIAPRSGDTYNFHIHRQGEKETIFFDR